MCAGGNTTIRKEEVSLYMGYYGGSLTIGNLTYDVENEARNRDQKSCTRKEMMDKIKSFTKEEIAQMIIDLVDNSEE